MEASHNQKNQEKHNIEIINNKLVFPKPKFDFLPVDLNFEQNLKAQDACLGFLKKRKRNNI